MNKTAKNIFKSLLLSSLMSLVHTNAKADKTANLPDLGFNPDDGDEVQKVKDLLTRNVIKVSPTGRIYEVKGHRSHQSHRSHTSSRGGHSSHYSSSHYSSTSSGTSSNRINAAYSAPKTKTPADYSFGDRTIKNGVYGADVDFLIDLLVKKNYFKQSQCKKKSGYAVYDPTVAVAVKHFQRDAGLKESGEVDNTVSVALQSWDKNKTTVELGFRDLKSGDCGYDVATLIELLNLAGFSPNPVKIEYCEKYAVFNEEIITAVKMFQAYNGLEVSGLPDTKTLAKLKTVKKK
ncbi:MAG: peptidoglycan-binding protein [Bacteroidales bacterium]|nr:peptidoglycan-binding protein [Bacteroidales bacterium]